MTFRLITNNDYDERQWTKSRTFLIHRTGHISSKQAVKIREIKNKFLELTEELKNHDLMVTLARAIRSFLKGKQWTRWIVMFAQHINLIWLQKAIQNTASPYKLRFQRNWSKYMCRCGWTVPHYRTSLWGVFPGSQRPFLKTLCSKAEATTELNPWQNSNGYSVKVVRSANWGELTAKRLLKHYTLGLAKELSYPRCSAENGRVKHVQQTI